MGEKTTYKNLEAEKATSKAYELYFKKDGTVIDITDYTIYFTLKENPKDTDANAKINKKITTHTDPINGTTEIELTSTDLDLPAKSYVYAVDVKDDAGKVYPLFRGRYLISEPIRKTKD